MYNLHCFLNQQGEGMSKSKKEHKNALQLNLDLNAFLFISTEIRDSNVVCFHAATQKKINKSNNNAVIQRLLKEAKTLGW